MGFRLPGNRDSRQRGPAYVARWNGVPGTGPVYTHTLIVTAGAVAVDLTRATGTGDGARASGGTDGSRSSGGLA